MLKHKLFSLLFVFVLMFSLVSSIELKVVKVDDLKTGDVIVDKNGNEIVVTNISTQPSESLTISEYIQQKVNGITSDENIALPKMVLSGSDGPGSITGNAIVSGVEEKTKLNNFQKMVNKIRSWFSR